MARVFPKIRLGTYDEEGNARAVVSDLRDPFFWIDKYINIV